MSKRYVIKRRRINTPVGKQLVYRIFDNVDRRYVAIWHLQKNAIDSCKQLNKEERKNNELNRR